MHAAPAKRGRWLVSIGATVLAGSPLLQWWQVGGGPGELPVRSDIGISSGPGFLMFLAAMACLLLLTLPLASGKPIPIDRPVSYLGLLGVGILGYGLSVASLAEHGLAPWPPARGVGLWLAVAGLALIAAGVFEDFRKRRGGGEDHDATDQATDETTAGERVGAKAEAEAEGPSTRPLYVPGWVMGAWRKLVRPSIQPDRSTSLDSEPRGHLDRLDIWVVAALVIVILSMRVYGLGQPTQMYFDEVYHARSATEFLQDWRYGISHDIYEWTHPMLAKYAIAAGITLFSDDKVTASGQVEPPVVEAVVQERTATSPGSPAPVEANAEIDYGTDFGDRVFVATGSEVRAYDLTTRALTHTYSIPGASVLSDPSADGLIYVGTSTGAVYGIDTNSLDDLRAGRTAEVKPAVKLSVDTGLSITHIYVGTPPYMLVSDASGNVVSIDMTAGAGEIVGRGVVPGAADFVGLGPSDPTPEVLVACRDGVAVLDARDAAIKSTVATKSPATSIALNPDAIASYPNRTEYRVYVTAGNSVVLVKVSVATATSVRTVSPEDSQPLEKMPGAVTRVVFDEATKIAHALGRTRDGSGWTVYAIEANGNAVFSDAPLPFEPVAISLDNSVQVQGFGQVTQMPDVDHETLLAFAPNGSIASVDVGQFAFSWRVIGVLFGALTAVCLYLLARILFRRRSVGLLIAFFSLVDGMLFAQSRIAMNDTYVGGLLLLAYLIFAVLWLKVWKNRFVFWLGMPLLGVVLGLALASKWVAFYSLASIGLLILIRSALGRLLTILGLAAGTGVLGWMALAEMQYQPDTGNGSLCILLFAAGVAVVAAGTLWVARTRVVADKVFVGVVTAIVAGLLLAGALLVSPGSLDNGAPNYTFLVIMLAITSLAAAANAYRPVAWTREELRFAIGAPPILGLVGPFLIAALLVPFGMPVSLGPLVKVALETGAAGLGVGIAAGAAFWVAGRVGFGPLAVAPRPGSARDLAGPPSPAPEGWLRLGSGFGLPAVWTALCVLILPFVVYIVMYIPWSMPWQPQIDSGPKTTGPQPAIACWHIDTTTGLCDNAWPAGHTGRTLWDLTIQMYDYHNDLRALHPAASPWWAWPLDLKPVWFDSGSDVPGLFSWIHDGGNPVLWWMAIFGVAFTSWQALKRRNLGLGLIAVAFFWQWLSWVRIDRASFQYHFYTALPFFLLALAYFLAELWHGPSRRTWLLARVAGAAALLMPGVLWLLKPELCGLARVDSTQYFQSTVCGAGTGDVVITEKVFLIGAVVIAALAALALVLWRLERRHSEGLEDPDWIFQLLAPVAVAAVITWGLGQAGPTDVLVHQALPSDALTLFPVLCGVFIAWFALTARNPRRFVLGACVAAVLVSAFMYPDLAAVWMPNAIQGIYSVTSPTWLYGFQFSTNLQVSAAVKVIGPESLSLVLVALLVAGVAAWAAWERRVTIGWRRSKLLGGAGSVSGSGSAGVACPGGPTELLGSTADSDTGRIEFELRRRVGP